MLVIHATVGNAASSLAWLCNPVSKASTNYLIDKSGHIYCLVPDSEAAWHAGVSAWRGLNSAEIQHRSLGIELENANDGRDPYPPAQMGALLWLARQKVAQYRIAPEWVVRHLDIAMPKGRKSDPAGFPWEKFKADLYAVNADPFAEWGSVGKPQGDQIGWAIPQMWLQHKAALGACRVAEQYITDDTSIALFVGGFVFYRKATNKAQAVIF
jgi:N-acetyl-anhydromuramyl-L-alanine amidase AmpD